MLDERYDGANAPVLPLPGVSQCTKVDLGPIVVGPNAPEIGAGMVYKSTLLVGCDKQNLQHGEGALKC